ncbi:PREDICTED: uncharacterized protein LOC104822446 isoform X1 [Tarenaya hassleriana]|uniref:uncharacterized protein LOC104822446 isoform X1 n=1 Tax=Tarenaya hassleriana TaxID=28532 RepID=UPI00053C3579|nr:PREDICTED: uncharacterized protein LOC104822446 isoform X1 [Tarenaya hassleriana]
MKQKILIRVSMTDDKTRARAMNKAVQFTGVTAVEIKGDHRNQIEVTGDEVDMIALTRKLRKQVAFAELVSVSKVEPPKKPDEKKDGDKKEGDKKEGEKKQEEKKNEEKKPAPCCPWPHGYGVPCYPYPYQCNPNQLLIGEPVYNHEPPCTIM